LDHLTDLRLVAQGHEGVKAGLRLVAETITSLEPGRPYIRQLAFNVARFGQPALFPASFGLDNPGPNFLSSDSPEENQAACRREHEALFANLPMLESLLLRQYAAT
jgi:hypothetical protein